MATIRRYNWRSGYHLDNRAPTKVVACSDVRFEDDPTETRIVFQGDSAGTVFVVALQPIEAARLRDLLSDFPASPQ